MIEHVIATIVKFSRKLCKLSVRAIVSQLHF